LTRGFLLSLLLLLLACGPATAAKPSTNMAAKPPASTTAGLTVEAVRFGFGSGGTRVVIDFNGKPTFRAFLLDGPRRLAVDLPAARWKAQGGGLAGQGGIKGWRTGPLKEGNLTRVIFDLSKPMIITDAFVLPRKGASKDRLVIDLEPASQNLFSARLSEVRGERNIGGASPPATPAQKKDRAPAPLHTPKNYTVVLDAGHGGGDHGASSNGIREKQITLAVARELKRQLEETGRYRVVLTRDSDRYIKLRERLAMSRKAKADLFISIHADKIGRNNVRGASIYTLSENASDEEAEALAENANTAGIVAGVDLKEESQDVAGILLDLAMREKMNESNVLAQAVEQALRRKNVKLLPNSHRSAGFAVLKAPDVPAILIETGFLSNREEAKLLSSAAFQQKIASAMLDGIDAYFRKMQALRKDR
jgi:N-acetylmuramoyl-L-alanine amidase